MVKSNVKHTQVIVAKVGQVCHQTGTYQCATCGFTQQFQASRTFPACEHCHDPIMRWLLMDDTLCQRKYLLSEDTTHDPWYGD